MAEEAEIRMALPSKGALETATSAFLAECGMKVNRKNPRQYLARIASMPDLGVVFQRVADIPALVQDGDAVFGITGYDLLAEHRGYGHDEQEEERDDGDLIVLLRDLEYGRCRLVVEVPETWIDVSNMADLWHLAGYYQTHKRRGLRIATKYPILTGRFLRQHGITHFKLISTHGALEAAPLTDTADLIVDLTETGTTLRASYAEGFKAPTLYQLYAPYYGNATLKPETAKSYDFGVEQRLIGDRLVASATWFHRDTHNQIDGDPLSFVYFNYDRTRAKGVELALTMRPTEGFTIQGSYSFIDTENLTPGADFGNDLARRPRQSASVSADYRFGFGLSIGGTVNIVGDSFDNAANATRLDGYALAGIRAEMPVTRSISVYGRVDNLFDEKYETVAGYGTYGRAAYGGIRLRFE